MKTMNDISRQSARFTMGGLIDPRFLTDQPAATAQPRPSGRAAMPLSERFKKLWASLVDSTIGNHRTA